MPETSSPQNEWRSPTGGDTLSFADEQDSPSEKENATHGEVYRVGRTRVELHGGHGGSEGTTVALAGGWKNTVTLKTAYQRADPETILRVVLEAGELREAR